MIITRFPPNCKKLIFARHYGEYGGFVDDEPQGYSILCMIQEAVINRVLLNNENIKIILTTSLYIHHHWVRFHPSSWEGKGKCKFIYNRSWIFLKYSFVEKYNLHNGFSIKNIF